MKSNKTVALLLVASAMLMAGCSKGGDTPKNSTVNSTKDEQTSVKADFDTTQTIKPYTRAGGSGTREGFFEKIGFGEVKKKDDSKFKSTVAIAQTNDDMIAQLAANEYSIGYFSFDSKSNAEAKGLKLLKFEGQEATEDGILDGTYKLAHNFNWCVNTSLTGDKKTLVEAFIAYMGSYEGMTIIKQNGGVIKISANAIKWSEIAKNYPTLATSDYSTITLNRGGSTSVDKIVKALEAAFSPLAGGVKFNDQATGSGDAYPGTHDQNKLDLGFASRDFDLTGTEKMDEGTFGRMCVDGIVVGVSAKNPLANITAAQAKAVYDGSDTTVNKWSDLIK